MRLFIIEDDKELSEILSERLRREGFEAEQFYDGNEALAAIFTHPPSLILLDLMLPGRCGLEICKEVRQKSNTAHVPIVMLTANVDESDIVSGLELGADDYVTKPFSFRQLLARIRAVLRRSESARDPNLKIQIGSLSIDPISRSATADGRSIDLTESEFQILYGLSSEPGKVFTRSELLQVMNSQADLVERNVDVHVSSLRKKMGRDGGRILTIRNVGYRFVEEEELSSAEQTVERSAQIQKNPPG
jgi:DNA-binding response OmpR family regulator